MASVAVNNTESSTLLFPEGNYGNEIVSRSEKRGGILHKTWLWYQGRRGRAYIVLEEMGYRARTAEELAQKVDSGTEDRFTLLKELRGQKKILKEYLVWIKSGLRPNHRDVIAAKGEMRAALAKVESAEYVLMNKIYGSRNLRIKLCRE